MSNHSSDYKKQDIYETLLPSFHNSLLLARVCRRAPMYSLLIVLRHCLHNTAFLYESVPTTYPTYAPCTCWCLLANWVQVYEQIQWNTNDKNTLKDKRTG